VVLAFVKADKLSLRKDPQHNEKWLHDRIAEDPTILGLGELELIDRERIQHNAGRLDLLLSDGDSTRYEVEIMLGSTDPHHIIRTIEYWDIERRRYPAYEHIAVLIAEDITSRFINVLSLMAGNIPMIAIQLNALKVEDRLVLDFVHVLNQTSLRRDDESEVGGDEVDRSYWDNRVGIHIMAIADEILGMVTNMSSHQFELKYLKGHIAVSEKNNWRNLVGLLPKRQYMHLRVAVDDRDAWVSRIEEAGLPISKLRQESVQVTVNPQQFAEHRTLISELIAEGMRTYQYVG
jgi:hypothetical protein